ncbi:hypothetical protein EV421DRAFT_1741860 [Armillaria borealis]|uniref:Uncharacterized protein n=1 Tax=Armillaria borealis TaxID=47425 RepID=A0AA39J005_9AGAR|nr:hypothetical protein EV421DRAFT_1741860 [Armillaria borealis]
MSESISPIHLLALQSAPPSHHLSNDSFAFPDALAPLVLPVDPVDIMDTAKKKITRLWPSCVPLFTFTENACLQRRKDRIIQILKLCRNKKLGNGLQITSARVLTHHQYTHTFSEETSILDCLLTSVSACTTFAKDVVYKLDEEIYQELLTSLTTRRALASLSLDTFGYSDLRPPVWAIDTMKIPHSALSISSYMLDDVHDWDECQTRVMLDESLLAAQRNVDRAHLGKQEYYLPTVPPASHSNPLKLKTSQSELGLLTGVWGEYQTNRKEGMRAAAVLIYLSSKRSQSMLHFGEISSNSIISAPPNSLHQRPRTLISHNNIECMAYKPEESDFLPPVHAKRRLHDYDSQLMSPRDENQTHLPTKPQSTRSPSNGSWEGSSASSMSPRVTPKFTSHSDFKLSKGEGDLRTGSMRKVEDPIWDLGINIHGMVEINIVQDNETGYSDLQGKNPQLDIVSRANKPMVSITQQKEGHGDQHHQYHSYFGNNSPTTTKANFLCYRCTMKPSSIRASPKRHSATSWIHINLFFKLHVSQETHQRRDFDSPYHFVSHSTLRNSSIGSSLTATGNWNTTSPVRLPGKRFYGIHRGIQRMKRQRCTPQKSQHIGTTPKSGRHPKYRRVHGEVANRCFVIPQESSANIPQVNIRPLTTHHDLFNKQNISQETHQLANFLTHLMPSFPSTSFFISLVDTFEELNFVSSHELTTYCHYLHNSMPILVCKEFSEFLVHQASRDFQFPKILMAVVQP